MAARAPAVASDGPAEATDGEEIILAGRAAQAQAPTPEQESEAWWRAVSGLGGSQAANAEEDDDDGAGDAFEDAPAHWFVAEAARATEHDFEGAAGVGARTATAPDEEAPGPVAGGHAGSAVELPPHEPPPHEPGIPALPLPPPPLPPGFLLPPRLPLGCVVEQRQDGSWELRASFDTRTAANRAMMAVMAAEPESEHAVSPREPCAATLPEPPTHTSRHQVAAKVLETAGGSGASLADSDEGSPHAAAEVAGKSPQEEPPATPAAAPPALPSPTSSLPWDAAKLKSANVMVLLDLDNWPSFFEKLPFELPKTGVLVAAFARKGGAGAPSGKKNGKKAAGSGSGLSVRSMTKNPAAQRMIARGQLHVEETRPVKDSADAVLCMFAAEASMHAGDGCVFVLISEDAIFLQAQTTLQAKRRTVMLVRSRSYDEVGTIVVQLNHQTMDDLVYLDGVRRGGKTAAQKGGAFGAASHPTNSSDHHKKPSSSKTKKPARVISLQQPGNVLQGRHVAFRQGGEGQGGPSQHGQGQAPLPPSAFAQSNQSHHPPLSATLHPDCLPPPMVPPAPQDVPRQLADRSQRPSGYEMHRRVTSHATPAGAHARGRWCANGKPTREVGAALRAFVQGQRHSRVVAALAARHLDENCPGWRGNAHSASLTPLRALCLTFGTEFNLVFGKLPGDSFGSAYVIAT